MSNQSNATSGGIGATTLLGILFVGLKLTGHIGWSWWWVTAPFWAPWVLAILFLGGMAVVIIAREWIS